MDASTGFTESRFPKSREIVGDMYETGHSKHVVYGLIELDVSKARACIRKHKEATGEAISFTGWIVKCLAQVVDEQKQVQGMRKGRGKIITFDDVDVLITVERDVNGKKEALPYIVRQANKKGLMDIHAEIRAAQSQHVDGGVLGDPKAARMARVFQSMPKILRKIVWNKYKSDPFFVKKVSGTVGITAVGMFGAMNGWAISWGMHPLDLAIGSVVKKPGVVGDRIEIREYLPVTAMIDHDITDGAPAARFFARLNEVTSTAYGLFI
jgi:pyruvate/2-oxoglutarate dehydrogenase complex dihydrolipoamide acyltransferase (E2) component